MSKKTDITDKLTAAGIAFDPEASLSELQALLPNDSAQGGTETIGNVEVGDPQLLRPVELPLVVKPAKNKDGSDGAWANDAQAEFAKYLNAYAYKNPKKWRDKRKDTTVDSLGRPLPTPVMGLISKLNDLAVHPERLSMYKGEGPDGSGNRISYTDKRIQQ